MNLDKIVQEALGHDSSEEWADLVRATVIFTRAMYAFDQALLTYKKRVQEQQDKVKDIVSDMKKDLE